MRVLLLTLIAFAMTIPESDQSGIKPKIIGGHEAPPGSHSWQVAILKNTKFICGGVLISPDWVLTAAQCLDGEGSIVVQFGAHNHKISEPAQVLKVVQKDNWFINPNFNNPSKANDIALIRIPESVPLTDHVQPIQLPENEDLYPNENEIAKFTGWGYTTDDFLEGKTSDVLLEVDLTTISNNDCQSYLPNNIDTGFLCTSGGTSGPCLYDVGGPLTYVREVDSVNLLVGIASYLPEDGCLSIYPRIFTRTSTYRQWIRETTGI